MIAPEPRFRARGVLARVCGLVLAGALSLAGAAVDPTAWEYQQTLEVAAAGPLHVVLPPATLDRAQPDQRDLRLLDPAGNEVPYLLLPATFPSRTQAPRSLQVSWQDDATIVRVDTGSEEPLAALTLSIPAGAFRQSAHIERSDDGRRWTTLATGRPFFRQGEAEQTRLVLGGQPAAHLRVTLRQAGAPPLTVTAAALEIAPPPDADVVTWTPAVAANEVFGDSTRLTVDLGAAHLPLTAIELQVDEPAFARVATASVREWREGEIVERVLAQRTLYRLALPGLPVAADLRLPLEATLPTRELILQIDHGDSPPLRLTGLSAERRPRRLVWVAPAPGTYRMLIGNPDTSAPRYDLEPLAPRLRQVPAATAVLGPPVVNPAYRRAEPLADWQPVGGAIEVRAWRWRRAVELPAAGVQQLELDGTVLARARADLADLRLAQGEQQIPYVLERTRLTRDFALSPIADPDTRRPQVGRWRLELPEAGWPLVRLSLETSARFFQRRVELYEEAPDYRGQPRRRVLAAAGWTRAPDETAPLNLALTQRPRTATLWIEMDHGDNAAFALTDVQGFSPVTRLLFKAERDRPLMLLYGREDAPAPRYDLRLAAAALLQAERQTARLGAAAAPAIASGGRDLGTSALFWIALSGVVIVLLVIVARLLPKPPAS